MKQNLKISNSLSLPLEHILVSGEENSGKEKTVKKLKSIFKKDLKANVKHFDFKSASVSEKLRSHLIELNAVMNERLEKQKKNVDQKPFKLEVLVIENFDLAVSDNIPLNKLESGSVEAEIRDLILNILKRGRPAQCLVVLTSQKVKDSNLPNDMKNCLNNKLIHKSSLNEGSYLGVKNDITQLSKGSFVYKYFGQDEVVHGAL